MFQSARDREVKELINALEAGSTAPTTLHHGARLYFPADMQETEPGTCLVCAATLIGQQQHLCSGHWDWLLFAPLEELQYVINPTAALIEFLEIFLVDTLIWSSDRNIELAQPGRSRCEVCNCITANVEELRNKDLQLIKDHVVCPAHQTFRWEE